MAVDLSSAPRLPNDDTAIIKSKLEQAVFYGIRSDVSNGTMLECVGC